ELGTLVTIEGNAMTESHMDKLGNSMVWFMVKSIDGKSLDESKYVVISLAFRKSAKTTIMPPDKQEKRIFRGYETGCFVGVPDAAKEDLVPGQDETKWKFFWNFQVVRDVTH